MKDRFSDTSKQIFDNPDFEEVQNAIGQLEQIIRVAQSRHRAGGHDDLNRVFPSTSAAAIAALAAAAGKSKEGSPTTTGGGPSGVSNINNNNIIIPTKTTKSNGIESIIAIPNANSGDCDAAAVNTNDKKTNKPVIIRNGGNHIKSSAVAAPTPYHKHNSSAVTTTTVILHNTDNNRNVVDDDGHVARPSASAATSVKAKVNGIKNSSSATTTQHASQPKGTATVSTETTRSGSKTPEITITPGSEVLGGDLVDTELPESRLLSSAESGVVERERVSPEDLPDSGCTGLLDEDEDSCSLQRAGSSSTAGDQIVGASSSAAAVGSGVSASDRGGGDRDSGGGSVASSSGTGAGAYQRSTAEIKEAIYAQLQKRRSGSSEQPLFPHHHPQQPLLHVEGPVDGSPYAIINPLVKQKTLADSGISVSHI
ncbi:unnamed protein product [Orchesella dallaii]|uniref:Uncharacterized protein n=1 Tax=Orchesella dallaii TaxID=48710 RepID=A0ABP1QRD9_9HEXA